MHLHESASPAENQKQLMIPIKSNLDYLSSFLTTILLLIAIESSNRGTTNSYFNYSTFRQVPTKATTQALEFRKFA